MTSADPPAASSEDDAALPPAWLIAIGIVVVLAVIFVVGYGVGLGFGGGWDAIQWGPVSEWVAGIATFAAVIVALQQSINARRDSMRAHMARLVDHEVSRRRECIEALSNLWAAITGLQMDFAEWTQYLDALPESFDPNQQTQQGSVVGTLHTYRSDNRGAMQSFSSKWQRTIEPALFAALLVLRGTDLYEPVGQVNEQINKMKLEGLEPFRTALTQGKRPSTEAIAAMWKNVIGRRDEHLKLARQHFSLTREDVEKSLRRDSKR